MFLETIYLLTQPCLSKTFYGTTNVRLMQIFVNKLIGFAKFVGRLCFSICCYFVLYVGVGVHLATNGKYSVFSSFLEIGN